MGVEVWTARDTREQGEATPQDLPELPQPVVQQSASSASDIEGMDAQTLQATVAACTKCRLSETRTNTVFGSGSLEADLMFIGEGPGQEEDRQGLPFVGKAGKLLTAMIAALGYERDQVYISNVVKCRPPKNRDPFPEEASACSRYLKRQIEIIKPKVIVALGRVSAQLLLDTEISIGALRGRPQKYHGTEIDVVVTYHPAYLLRRPTEKRKSWDDLWRVRQLLNQST